jgi:hypothetical protein
MSSSLTPAQIKKMNKTQLVKNLGKLLKVSSAQKHKELHNVDKNVLVRSLVRIASRTGRMHSRKGSRKSKSRKSKSRRSSKRSRKQRGGSAKKACKYDADGNLVSGSTRCPSMKRGRSASRKSSKRRSSKSRSRSSRRRSPPGGPSGNGGNGGNFNYSFGSPAALSYAVTAANVSKKSEKEGLVLHSTLSTNNNNASVSKGNLQLQKNEAEVPLPDDTEEEISNEERRRRFNANSNEARKIASLTHTNVPLEEGSNKNATEQLKKQFERQQNFNANSKEAEKIATLTHTKVPLEENKSIFAKVTNAVGLTGNANAKYAEKTTELENLVSIAKTRAEALKTNANKANTNGRNEGMKGVAKKAASNANADLKQKEADLEAHLKSKTGSGRRRKSRKSKKASKKRSRKSSW